MADPAALTQQELVDYLVTAVEEADVQYVVYWLQEMRKRGLLDSCLDPAAKGINLDHSTLRYSALVSAVTRPHSELREAILLILLAFTRAVDVDAEFRATRSEPNDRAAQLVDGWKQRQNLSPLTKELQGLVDLGPFEAEAWIAEHLPPHPEPDTLTGYGPLPRLSSNHPPDPRLADLSSDSYVLVSPDPPPSEPDSSTRLTEAFSNSRAPSGSQSKSCGNALHPGNLQTSPSDQLDTQETVAAPSDEQRKSLPHQPVELELGNLPLDTTDEELARISRYFGLEPELLAIRNFSRSKSAILRVASEHEFRAASAGLEGAQLRGHYLFLTRVSHQPSPHDPIVILRNLPTSSRVQTLHELVIRAQCGGYGIRIRGEGQMGCMGVFRAPSEEAARLAVSRLDGLLVSGREIRAEWRSSV